MSGPRPAWDEEFAQRARSAAERMVEDRWKRFLRERYPNASNTWRETVAKRAALRGEDPPVIKKGLKDQVTEAMGLKEKLAALVLLRWVKGDGVELVRTYLGNVKAAKLGTVLGVLGMALSGLCVTGQEVLPHETCQVILPLATTILSIKAMISPQASVAADPKK